MISFGTLPAARASDVFSPKGNKANAQGGREVSFTFVSPETPGTSLCRRSVSAARFQPTCTFSGPVTSARQRAERPFGRRIRQQR